VIHVIGNAAIDTVVRLDRFPRPGETVIALGASEDLGGKGANQAVVAARCGQPTRLVAAIGADASGERIRASLAAEGVGVEQLSTWTGATDRCIVYVDREGENTIVSAIEAALNFEPGNLALEPGDWVLMQGNLRPGVTRERLARAKASGASTMLNPSPTWAAREYDWSLADLVVLNRQEAVELGGRENPLEAARALANAGAGAVVLTLGAEGAAFVTRGEELHVKAREVDAVDTVGAGDVFCGTLVSARVAGAAWRDALSAAAAAAAICVCRAGVQASFPARAEMAAIMREIRRNP